MLNPAAAAAAAAAARHPVSEWSEIKTSLNWFIRFLKCFFLCREVFHQAFYEVICFDSVNFALQVPGGPTGPAGSGPFKLNIVDSIERIKEEFNFLQAQYHK